MSNNAATSAQADANQPPSEQPRPTSPQVRAVSDPVEVANVVLWHIDALSDRQSEQMAATKALTDLMKQLLRAYGEHKEIIRRQEARIRELEASLAGRDVPAQ